MDKIMTRESIYKVIDNERDYQDRRWPGMDDANSMGDFMVYMKHHLDDAFKHAAEGKTMHTRDSLRKVVALGVACFERWGVTDRFIIKPITNE